jgi:hypothetical protein
VVGWRFFSNTEIFWFKIREKERCVHGVVFRLQKTLIGLVVVLRQKGGEGKLGEAVIEKDSVFFEFFIVFFFNFKIASSRIEQQRNM